LKSLHTANMVDCFKECAHDQLEDAFVDVKPGRTRKLNARALKPVIRKYHSELLIGLAILWQAASTAEESGTSSSKTRPKTNVL
jgi:hypothetical protein